MAFCIVCKSGVQSTQKTTVCPECRKALPTCPLVGAPVHVIQLHKDPEDGSEWEIVGCSVHGSHGVPKGARALSEIWGTPISE